MLLGYVVFLDIVFFSEIFLLKKREIANKIENLNSILKLLFKKIK
ncbi:MAG: hypothetical protein PWQ67_1834 [Clostridia bacterium]|jgi:hypothetical protein|nr:hypothetical protein [Clostridia bacterium]MDN5323380.1 hypothetical protein [Clostridia bacterium]